MRFAFAGIDMLAPTFEALLQCDWTPRKLFTRPCDGLVDFNERVVGIARQHALPIQATRITPADIAALADDGVECLVVAGYKWRITGWEGVIPYAFNIHPSLLPEARGPFPVIRALIEGRGEWGVSAHKLAHDFDTGDILGREGFALAPSDTLDSVMIRCQFAAGRLAARIAQDLPAYWGNAEIQGKGSYWDRPSDTDRQLRFDAGTRSVLDTVRAFGRVETIARLDGHDYHVAAACGWEEEHGMPAGQVVHDHGGHLTITTRDGFVVLTRWSPIALHQRGAHPAG